MILNCATILCESCSIWLATAAPQWDVADGTSLKCYSIALLEPIVITGNLKNRQPRFFTFSSTVLVVLEILCSVCSLWQFFVMRWRFLNWWRVIFLSAFFIWTLGFGCQAETHNWLLTQCLLFSFTVLVFALLFLVIIWTNSPCHFVAPQASLTFSYAFGKGSGCSCQPDCFRKQF